MAFVRRLGRIMPTMGVPRQDDQHFLQQGFAITGTGGAVRLPTVGNFSPTIASGWVRIKISSPTSISLTSVWIAFNDAQANQEQIWPLWGGSNPIIEPSGATLVLMVPFLSDLNVTYVTVTITSTGAGIADVEVAATSGDIV